MTPRPRIVVTGRIPEAAVNVLRRSGEVVLARERTTTAVPTDTTGAGRGRPIGTDDQPPAAAELRVAVTGADALVTLLHDRVDDALLAAAGDRLRVVSNVAVGFDNIDLDACRRRNVTVTNTPGVLVDATADLTMALLLAVTRRVAEGDRLLRAGTPWSWGMSFMLGTGLQGRLLGLVGFGRIGRAVARRATAFGLEILYATRNPVAAEEVPAAARRVPLAELLERSDVVSLHCPLTTETRHLIDRRALQTMQPTAYLVNTARGPVVDEEALAEGLEQGWIAGAALDVFEHEPRVHPGLLASERVVLTPHLGSATVQTREAMAVLAAQNVTEVLAGRPALTPVWAPSLPRPAPATDPS